eukprot:COSAG06_NODE_3171_length_5738_cov_7.226281_8_plen_72_part_01
MTGLALWASGALPTSSNETTRRSLQVDFISPEVLSESPDDACIILLLLHRLFLLTKIIHAMRPHPFCLLAYP